MRRIALVSTSYPDEKPGSEAAGSFVEDFAKALSTEIPVTVIAPGRNDSECDEGRVRVRRFAVPMTPLSLLNPANPLHWTRISSTLTAGRRALEAVLDAEDIDHVLALWALPSGWWAQAAARRHGIGYSTWALGSDIWSLGRIPVVRGVLRRVLDRAEGRYADGLQLCADVERLCGKPCAFLPSSRRLHVERIEPIASAPPYKLAFLGRWHPNKGVDLLLEALEGLSDEDWSRIAEVRVFGGGPLEDQVHASGRRLAESGRPVSIGGFLAKDDAARLLGWADYLVLPSRIESIPVIYSDALQVGTPLIATPVGDLPRLFERNETGLLARDASAASLLAAIRAAVSDDASRFAESLETARAGFDVSAAVRQFVDDTGLAAR